MPMTAFKRRPPAFAVRVPYCFVLDFVIAPVVISKNGNVRSSGRPVIVVEHSAEAASTSDRPIAVGETGIRENEQITDALMISLAMIMRDELPNGCAQRALPEQNHPFQTGLLYRTDEAFGVAVQVR